MAISTNYGMTVKKNELFLKLNPFLIRLFLFQPAPAFSASRWKVKQTSGPEVPVEDMK